MSTRDPVAATASRKAEKAAASVAPQLSSSSIYRSFSCPITGELMRDPVMTCDGFSYEKEAIAIWLRRNDNSPMTGRRLVHKELVPNHALRGAIEEHATANVSNKLVEDSDIYAWLLALCVPEKDARDLTLVLAETHGFMVMQHLIQGEAEVTRSFLLSECGVKLGLVQPILNALAAVSAKKLPLSRSRKTRGAEEEHIIVSRPRRCSIDTMRASQQQIVVENNNDSNNNKSMVLVSFPYGPKTLLSDEATKDPDDADPREERCLQWTFCVSGNNAWSVGVVPETFWDMSDYLHVRGRVGLSSEGTLGASLPSYALHGKTVQVTLNRTSFVCRVEGRIVFSCYDLQKMFARSSRLRIGICGFANTQLDLFDGSETEETE